MSSELFYPSGKINMEFVRDVFYNPINESKTPISLTRLTFIPEQLNMDFDNFFEGDTRKLFLNNKIKILRAMRAISLKKLWSLPKGEYKVEMSKINSHVADLTEAALKAVAHLGSLNDDALLPINLNDIGPKGQIIEGGREVVMTNKDINNILHMVNYMNKMSRTLVRGSKTMNPAKKTISPSFEKAKRRNFIDRKHSYYQVNDNLRRIFCESINTPPPSDVDATYFLDIDTMGVIEKDNKVNYPLDSESDNFFLLSDTFTKGIFKGTTFTHVLSVLNYNFRITQWYLLAEKLMTPLIFNSTTEESSKKTDKKKEYHLVYVFDDKKDLLDTNRDVFYYFNSSKKDVRRALQRGIKSNIERSSLEELYEYQGQLKSSSLHGIERNMRAFECFKEPGTALKTYKKTKQGIHLVPLEEEDVGLSVIEALMDKTRFNPDNLTNSSFDQFLNVVGEEVIVSGKEKEEADDDAVKITEHTNGMLEVKKRFSKFFMIDFIRQNVNRQIQRLNQVGATTGITDE